MESQSLLLMRPYALEWVTERLAEPGAGEALVRTTAGAVSVGTEAPQYTGAERVIVARGYPRMTGYESVGVVLATGEGVDTVAPGERVVAFYGHRTHAIVPAEKLLRIPPEIPDTLALLAILSCEAAKGVRKLAPEPDTTTLITGAGAIGLLTLFILREYGVRQVDVIEPRAERRALALRLGARQALAPEQATQLRDVYQAGFECSSRNAAFALLQERMAPGASICVLADGNIEPLALAPAFHASELRLVASSDGWDYQRHAAWYFSRALASRAELEALFEVETMAEDLPSLFARMVGDPTTPLKIYVRYHG